MTTSSPGWSVRPVEPDDASGVIHLITNVVAEPVNNLLTEPGEFTLTVDQERAFLAEQRQRPDWVGFVATPDADPTAIIGLVTGDGLRGRRPTRRRAIQHRATIGLTVAEAWRGKGIGRALMERVIEWARASEAITRLELEVLVRNAAAIRLYERLGFEREGVVRSALWRNGEYLDELVMGLLL